MSSRGKARVPYADWMEDSDDIAADDSDEYVSSFSIYDFSDRKSKIARSDRIKIRKEIPQVDILSQYMSRSDPRVNIDPNDKECRFIDFNELLEHKYNLESIFKAGENGINTLVPNEVKPDEFLRELDIEYKPVEYTMEDLASMTDEELKETLERVENELNVPTDFKGLNSDFVIVPPWDENIEQSISICESVLTLDWKLLGSKCKFDVIIMDPPWMITPSQVTRGVYLDYKLLETEKIRSMPLHLVQDNGYCFIWVVASMLSAGIEMLQNWGYKVISFGNWIKVSKFGRYAPSNGYFLQHDKETFIVGVKGSPLDGANLDQYSDVILQERSRQSQKPDQLYEFIERMFPGRMYLEIFARAHNIREGWVSIGLDLPK